MPQKASQSVHQDVNGSVSDQIRVDEDLNQVQILGLGSGIE